MREPVPGVLPAPIGETAKAVHNPTPGLTTKFVLPAGPVRGLYTASNGDLYAVGGAGLYYVSPAWATTLVGTLATATGPVSMADNTLSLVVVDGSAGGLQVDLPTRASSPMPSAAAGFYGADRVDFISTFLTFNKPNTPQFYVSDSLATTFNALYFANKTTAQDYLVAAIAARGQLWLIGRSTTEVWTLSGAPDFPFQALQGVLIEHGCGAVGSIAKTDGALFFLALNKQGRGIVLQSAGYQLKRISTFALETLFATYTTASAVGYCYQSRGHTFYVLSFPNDDATWVYDEAAEDWHQWSSPTGDGLLHRHRSNCFAFAYNLSLVGDFATGAVYALDGAVTTENGVPIPRIRSFPHIVHEGNRMMYEHFIADMDVATALPGAPAPTVSLRWSDDRGATWGNPVTQSLGASGATYTSLQWRRLGYARDRVFELSWTGSAAVSLIGAFIGVHEAAT